MNEQLIKLLNGRRKHKLLTAALIKKLPDLYAQDGKGDKAIVYVKLFTPCSDFTWYITEYRPEENMAFGLVWRPSMGDQCPEGEYGYVSITELETLQRGGMPSVERDLYFTQTTLGGIKERIRQRSEA